MSPTGESTTGRHVSSGHPILGSTCLVAAATIFLLAAVDQSGGLPFPMPHSWYADRPLWYLAGLGCLLAGCFLLWNPPKVTPASQDLPPGVRFDRLVLYTRKECPLCDEAREVLRRYDRYLPPVEEVDVDGDPQLVEQYGGCVPVVEIDGKVRFRGKINEVLLRRLIEASPSRSAATQ